MAAANEDAYMRWICNYQTLKNNVALGSAPLVVGEWWLAAQWNATDCKLIYTALSCAMADLVYLAFYRKVSFRNFGS